MDEFDEFETALSSSEETGTPISADELRMAAKLYAEEQMATALSEERWPAENNEESL